jgi:hypothetical protein
VSAAKPGPVSAGAAAGTSSLSVYRLGKTKARTGRPRGSGLIQCVLGFGPGPQGTSPTCGLLGGAGLDRPGGSSSRIFSCSDVHNDVHNIGSGLVDLDICDRHRCEVVP